MKIDSLISILIFVLIVLPGRGTLIEAYLVERNIRLNEVMEFDTCEAALSLVAKGLGITVVPFSNKRLFEAGQHFTLIPFGKPQLRRRIGLYQKNTTRASVSCLCC